MNDHDGKPAPIYGEKELKENLLHSAEGQFALGRSQEVIQSFREAAISYRVSAANYATLIEHYQGQRDWIMDILQLYRNWGEVYAEKIDPAWEGNGPIPCEYIRDLVVEKLLDESTLSVMFLHLQDQLENRGIHIFSPGGSIQRHVCRMLNVGFNHEPDSEYDRLIIREYDIRVALEPIAQRVLASWKEAGRQTKG